MVSVEIVVCGFYYDRVVGLVRMFWVLLYGYEILVFMWVFVLMCRECCIVYYYK